MYVLIQNKLITYPQVQNNGSVCKRTGQFSSPEPFIHIGTLQALSSFVIKKQSIGVMLVKYVCV